MLNIYRNRLPHWRLPGSAYFVTWRIREGSRLLPDSERAVVAEALRFFHGKRYRLYVFAVMDDHVHVIVQPLGERQLSKIVQGWKSFTAYRLQREYGREGGVWQKDYMDRIVRSETDLYEKATYIVNNPAKRWPELMEYPWVGWFEF